MRKIVFLAVFYVLAYHVSAQTWSISPFGTGTSNAVLALYSPNEDTIYAGGKFTSAGGQSANHIAMWAKNQWYPMGQGFFENVKTITSIKGKIFVGGEFSYYKDSQVNCFAEWDGTRFNGYARGFFKSGQHTVATTINSIVEYKDEIYAGGIYDYANDQADYTKNLAKWNGTKWEGVGGGVDGASGVNCMIVYHNELYVGGGFTNAGSILAKYIAKWDGTTWSEVGGGMNGEVTAMEIYNDTLYAAGVFTQAGTTAAQRIAKLSGNTWQALGQGLSGPVYALVAKHGVLYAGGVFAQAGVQPVKNIAYWFHDWNWREGPKPSSIVWCMTTSPGDQGFIAGGDFTTISTWSGTETPTRIARIVGDYGGMPEYGNSKLTVYPNPSSGLIRVDASDEKMDGIRVFNMLGEEIISRVFTPEIDVSHLPAGNYFLVLSNAKGMMRTMITVSHD